MNLLVLVQATVVTEPKSTKTSQLESELFFSPYGFHIRCPCFMPKFQGLMRFNKIGMTHLESKVVIKQILMPGMTSRPAPQIGTTLSDRKI